MFNRYYQEELTLLKELGAEFSQAHPALAPMLSGQTSDPDVERLLEGTAFLTGLVRHKLDDEFPELLHGVMNLLAPHYLRPVPSSSILAFTPRPTLREPLLVPAGTEVASVPVDGTSCVFRTCFDIEALPLRIKNAAMEQRAGLPPRITIQFELAGIPLAALNQKRIRLYLAGGIPQGSDLYYHLMTNVAQVELSSPDGKPCILPASAIQPVGFGQDDALLHYPRQSFPAYRLLQEYFMLPEKFLFVDIEGIERWTSRGRGSSFSLSLQLKQEPAVPVPIKQDSFLLFATPIINLFHHDAEPIRYDHRKSRYLIRPSGAKQKDYQIIQVEKVSGFMQGTSKEKAYISFQQFSPQYEAQAVYNISIAKSVIDDSLETYISVAYPGVETAPVEEVLSLKLLCTNATLPENLGLGDICRHTSTSPELLEFSNIRPATMNVQPPLGASILWRLLSHASINLLTIDRPEALKTILDLYVFTEGRDKASILANKKRVAGIERVEIQSINRLMQGIMARGIAITLHLKRDNFAGIGDMYLFGSVLDRFLGWYSTINSFTSLTVREVNTGETYTWPARNGEHFLI
ncbi:type VI secretion system baseplate subunit TssF [uncultured Desulfobulbus sp.]|uniref:type VI secretion system baseplate subunit TssF n=1 Tax=uncultured Desulfobulbus sp. TaxID=239745 RepID=UPI0029C765C3|nr:type VI secretion system baseplate subunit TssF [uncultured Desulfobulbus sp.]